MKFRQAFALLFMSSIYRNTSRALDAHDMWADWKSFLAGAIVIGMGVGLCVIVWRVMVGEDQW